MQNIIPLGHFFVRIQWLVLTVSAVAGYIVLQLRLKEIESYKSVVKETIFNSFMIIGFVWKFSLIIFEPIKFVKNPLELMYFSGGMHGFLLALAIAAAYVIYTAIKQKLSVWVYADVIAAGLLAAIMLYNTIALVLDKQYMLSYGSNLLLAALLLLWQLKCFKPVGRKDTLNQLLLWFSLGKILIFHFKTGEDNFSDYIWNIPMQQLLFYVLAIFTAGVNLFYGRKKLVSKETNI